MNIFDRIQELKREKNAVIMAHYYVEDQVQDVADYIGDSFYLARMATEIEADTIVLCGVTFMGESAKVLNQKKHVLLPAPEADCPMAHMADLDTILAMREKYEDLAVVCYVNSTAELKAASDVCVTSANALKICRNLPNQNIYFIPDQHLAHFIADALPEKNFIFNDGYCPVHHEICVDEVKASMEQHPDAEVLVHPECPSEIIAVADYTGSTSGIINYVAASSCQEFIIVTEMGVLHKLRQDNPDKKFYLASEKQVCPDMKQVTLERVLHVLETGDNDITMSQDLMDEAMKPMARMLELS